MSADPERPNPDELLMRVQEEEHAHSRGKLKIFLGYAAGVGKTYAMLEAAHQRQAEGINVLVGYVETHGRAETQVLLEGLVLLPRQQVLYRGVTLPELDVDAVLAYRPQLVLVDELAHSNAPGSRHPKRYQDVEELLQAGIDVYTALNVQHFESLNDVVGQITGIIVRETVPDRLLDEAAEIELVDLPPEELLQRLQEGKVYVPEQAERAIDKFFRKGNLTALRELALRRTAERVDEQMHAYMETRAIRGPWAAAERLLVCLGSDALAERLVRTTRRLADELSAEWLAVHVETPDPLSPAARERLSHTLRLAEQLGGKVISVPGAEVVPKVLEVAHSHNVTKIVAGKPLRSRWLDALRGPVVDGLIRHSGSIDVYVISGDAERAESGESSGWVPHPPWRRYLGALGLVMLGSLLSYLVAPFFTPSNLVMIYLLMVVVAAAYLGRGPSVVASVLGVLAYDYFFVPPSWTFAVSDTQYLLTFAGLLMVGIVISQLTARVREQAEAASRRETQTVTLYELSRDLAVADDLDDIMAAVIRNVSQTFGRKVAIFLPVKSFGGKGLRPYATSPDFPLDPNELAVAAWALQRGLPAGLGTDTLSASQIRCLPLKTSLGVVGVLGVGAQGPVSLQTPDQLRLLDAFASQAATAIERAQLAEAARNAQVSSATERLQTALLNSISHDLRTPLVSITGALSSLQEDGNLPEPVRHSLIDSARDEAERLNRLVGNLLEMSRMEAGALEVIKQPGDLQDAVGSALEQLGSRLDSRPIKVEIPDDLPLVPMDFALIVQVLVNLVDNAVKYSPSGSGIEISARQSGNLVALCVADRGTGIPAEDLERIFDKFYRVERSENVTGTGLGLAICKGIIEAHDGKIQADNRLGGGTLITLSLPLETPTLTVEPLATLPA